jgi:hypothetical protein
MRGASPAVDTVTRRLEKFKPQGAWRARTARTSAVKLARGSPMPMNTRLVRGLSAGTWALALRTWPTISPALRLRLSPWRAVRQKRQPRAHPTWLDTHRVLWSSSGMSTDSMLRPSANPQRNFWVPSWEICRAVRVKPPNRAREASSSRKVRLDRSFLRNPAPLYRPI